MIDVRFPTALQIMLSLALAQAESVELLSSAQLAEGVDSSPTSGRSCSLNHGPRRGGKPERPRLRNHTRRNL
jgi:hypothetical protein